MPQSARLSAGGCNRHLGNAQIEVAFLSVGLPLLLNILDFGFLFDILDFSGFFWFLPDAIFGFLLVILEFFLIFIDCLILFGFLEKINDQG